MNKRGQEGFIACIIIVLIIIGLFWVFVLLNDSQQEANCKAMGNNGYNTHIEYIKMAGFTWKDCYIETSPGKSVPYDRFMARD